MKKIVVALAVFSSLLSCSKLGENEFEISGTAAGIEDGTLAILETQDESGMGLIAKDTAVIKDGKFTFKGTVTEPELQLIQIEKLQDKIVFILENGPISITVYKDSLNKSLIGGTFNNDQFAKYNKEQGAIQKKIVDFRTAKMQQMQEAMATNDSVTMNSIRNEFAGLETELNELNFSFAEKNPKAFISVLMLENMFYQPNVNFERVEKLFKQLDPTVKNTKPGKKLSELISNFSAASVGKPAPDFSAPNPDGKIISLKESLGKVTLIDFWAAWCAPCRKENPNVVALYNEFKDKGLQIIGVSLDKEGDDEKWKQAILTDKLTWPQVSNLKYWNDPIAKKYNIQGIPAIFILDANGVIVAKDLRGAELREKVQELLAAN
jgi:peroxiredoxin